MMLVYPNYDKCILNVVSSVRQYYRTPVEYKTLPYLDKELEKRYKNIVMIILDGMGADVVTRTLPRDSFLRKNMSQKITTVYPSTTVSAMTSYYTGVSPNEHAWLGWSLFFKEFCRCIDVFKNCDSFTKQPMTQPNIGGFVMPYENIFKDIAVSKRMAVQPFTVMPRGISFPETGNIHKQADSFEDICSLVKKICATDQNTFTFAYWDDPDDVIHKFGVAAQETKNVMSVINDCIEELCDTLTDTLFIISADHGMIDIDEEVFINEIPELDRCLIMPPSMEGRAAAFFVKTDMSEEFCWQFNRLLGKDFKLMSAEEFLSKEILGSGRTHPKTADFIGDFIACGIGKKAIRYRTLNSRPKPRQAAAHAGLTDEEMTVPLICVGTEITAGNEAKADYLDMILG